MIQLNWPRLRSVQPHLFEWGFLWYNGTIAWGIDKSRTIIYASGAWYYAEISMASDYKGRSSNLQRR